MLTFTYQPALRPALPCVYGPIDYREQRFLFQRIDSRDATDFWTVVGYFFEWKRTPN
jgi:hypothetical protein